MSETSSAVTSSGGVTAADSGFGEGDEKAPASQPQADQPVEAELSAVTADGPGGAEATPEDQAPAAGDESSPAPAARQSSSKAEDLFKESEIAADYIEGLLDILDLDGDIDELVVSGRPMVEVIEGGDSTARRLQSLVGARGITLESLQELTRLAVYRKTGSPSRVLLDIGGYRTARRKELTAVAKNAAEKVKEYGEAVRLETMSAFERKCVHDVINAMPGVASESEGTEPARRVVVSPVR